ncbi:MAG: hypothetical protein H0U40_01900 [Chloroflexia bacterium]|nr:hypothetical protein [Chloroflexia bacterium]
MHMCDDLEDNVVLAPALPPIRLRQFDPPANQPIGARPARAEALTRRAASDAFGRRMTSPRISLTDRCDDHCLHDMPAFGMRLQRRAELLTDEELLRTVGLCARIGCISPVSASFHEACDRVPLTAGSDRRLCLLRSGNVGPRDPDARRRPRRPDPRPPPRRRLAEAMGTGPRGGRASDGAGDAVDREMTISRAGDD